MQKCEFRLKDLEVSTPPYGKLTGKTHMCTLYTNPSKVSQYAGYAHFYQQCDFLGLVLLMGVTA